MRARLPTGGCTSLLGYRKHRLWPSLTSSVHQPKHVIVQPTLHRVSAHFFLFGAGYVVVGLAGIWSETRNSSRKLSFRTPRGADRMPAVRCDWKWSECAHTRTNDTAPESPQSNLSAVLFLESDDSIRYVSCRAAWPPSKKQRRFARTRPPLTFANTWRIAPNSALRCNSCVRSPAPNIERFRIFLTVSGPTAIRVSLLLKKGAHGELAR